MVFYRVFCQFYFVKIFFKLSLLICLMMANHGIQKIPDDDPLRKDQNRSCESQNSSKFDNLIGNMSPMIELSSFPCRVARSKS